MYVYVINKKFSCAISCCATADILTKLLQQWFLFFIVVVILGHNLGNSQVSVYRTIGPTLVKVFNLASFPPKGVFQTYFSLRASNFELNYVGCSLGTNPYNIHSTNILLSFV